MASWILDIISMHVQTYDHIFVDNQNYRKSYISLTYSQLMVLVPSQVHNFQRDFFYVEF